jgi:hypothetical protein
MARRPDFVVAGVAAVALVLFGLAAVSLTASLTTLPVDADLERIRAAEPVALDRVHAAARASDRAALWFEDCRHETNALLALGATPAVPPREMERRVTLVLARCPTSPFNWMRLAVARQRLGNLAGARAAWRASVLMGAYMPGLDPARTETGLRLFDPADAEHADLLSRQLRTLAREDAYAVAMMVRRVGNAAFVRSALSGEASREAFDRALAA